MNTKPYSVVNGQPSTLAEAAGEAPQLQLATVASWVQTSQLVLYSQAIKHEIEVHKWCESEKVGHDIGWELASASWHLHYGHLP